MVLEIGQEGEIRPLGVWAGTEWDEISREVKERLKGQPHLLVSDGETGLENWMSRIVGRSQRSHWHFSRGSRYALWEDGAPLKERYATSRRLSRLLAIEIPEGDIEFVSESDKEKLRDGIQSAEKELAALREEFAGKGYTKAAAYMENVGDRVFSHLKLWLETGLVAPRTSSIVENFIRELVRRLKKIGWNWTDEGATRMGRVVMMRRYDNVAWEKYWRDRMNLQGRCEITLTRWEVTDCVG